MTRHDDDGDRAELPSDALVAEQLGITVPDLLAQRAKVAGELLDRGTKLTEARKEAEQLIAVARDALTDVAVEAYRLGMGYDLIAQCTGATRLHPDGRRLLTKSQRGVVSHASVLRWVKARLESADA